MTLSDPQVTPRVALTGDHTAPSGRGITERAIHLCPAEARKSLSVAKAQGLGWKVPQTTLQVREQPSYRLLKSVFPGLSLRGSGMARGPWRREGHLMTCVSVGQPGIPGTTKQLLRHNLLMLKAAGQASPALFHSSWPSWPLEPGGHPLSL